MVDRIWSEHQSVQKSSAYPEKPATGNYAVRFTPGSVHPNNAYFYLVDASIVSTSDTHEEWQLLYRADLKAFATAAGLTWPDLLAKDRYSKRDEYGDDSSTITWTFDVINPDAYTPPAKNTAHPLVASAVLVAESAQRDGPVSTITRRYEKLASLTDYEQDEETNDWVTTTRQIVFSTSQPDTPSPGTEVSQRALGTGFSLRVTRTITGGGGASLPTAYEYRDYIDYSFPRLMTDIITYTDGDSFKFSPQIRSGYSKKMLARISVDFHAAAPTASTLFQLFPADWSYDGFTFDVHENNLITDAWDFSNIGGESVETWTSPASDPTYTEYTALIGTEVLINERVTPWRFNLWRRMRIYIELE